MDGVKSPRSSVSGGGPTSFVRIFLVHHYHTTRLRKHEVLVHFTTFVAPQTRTPSGFIVNSNPISRPIFINMPCKETTKNVQWEVVGGVFKSLRVNDLMNLRSKRSLTWVRLLSSCYWRRNHPFFLRSQRCLHLLTPTENCTEPFSFLLFFFFLEDQKR